MPNTLSEAASRRDGGLNDWLAPVPPYIATSLTMQPRSFGGKWGCCEEECSNSQRSLPHGHRRLDLGSPAGRTNIRCLRVLRDQVCLKVASVVVGQDFLGLREIGARHLQRGSAQGNREWPVGDDVLIACNGRRDALGLKTCPEDMCLPRVEVVSDG